MTPSTSRLPGHPLDCATANAGSIATHSERVEIESVVTGQGPEQRVAFKERERRDIAMRIPCDA